MSSPQCSLVWPLSHEVVSECIRPPTRFDASKTVDVMPASWRVSAAFRPAMPAPMIAIRRWLPDGLVADAKAAAGLSAAAPAATPATFRKSRRVTPAWRRSSRTAATEWPERPASSKSRDKA